MAYTISFFILLHFALYISPLAQPVSFVFVNIGFATGQTVLKLKHQRENSIWM